MTVERIDIVVAGRIDTGIVSALQRISQAATTAHTALQRLNQATNNGLRTQAFTAAATQAASAANRLNTAMQTTAARRRTFDDAIASAATKVLALYAAFKSVEGAANFADSVTRFNTQLRGVSDSEGQFQNLKLSIEGVARAANVSLSDVASQFARFDRALKPLGTSQQTVLTLTETLNKAMQLNGTAAQEGAAGVYQLAQAFGKGKLDGDEFRSVAENLPFLLDALASSLKVSRGELFKLSADGKITAKVLQDAIILMSTDINKRFAALPRTFSAGFTTFGNAIFKFLDRLETKTGVISFVTSVVYDFAAGLENASNVGSGALARWQARLELFNGALGGLPALVGTELYRLGQVLVNGLVNGPAVLEKILLGIVDSFGAMLRGISYYSGQANVVIAGFSNSMFASLNAVIARLQAFTANVKIAGENLANIFNSDYTPKLPLSASDISNLAPTFKMFDVDAIKKQNDADLADLSLYTSEKFKQYLTDRTAQLEEADRYSGLETRRGLAFSGLRQADPDKQAASAGIPGTDEKGGNRRAKFLAQTNLELDKEISRMKLLLPEREKAAALDNAEVALAGHKIAANSAEGRSILNKTAAIEAYKETQKQLDSIFNSTVQPLRDYQAGLEAANRLLKEGVINTNQYEVAIGGLKLKADEAAQTFSGGFAAGLQSVRNGLNDVSGNIRNGVENAFGTFSDTIADFAAGAKVSFKDMARDIAGEAIRLYTRLLILRPFLNAIGGDIGGTGGGGGGLFAGLPGFATGGSMVVKGRPGTDSNVAAFRVSNDERIDILTPAQQRAQASGNGVTVVNNNTFNGMRAADKAEIAQAIGQSTQAAIRAAPAQVQSVRSRSPGYLRAS